MKLDTLSDLMRQADIQFVVFDLGRRIRRISPQLFIRIEHGDEPYPYPFKQHAWIGLVGWPKDNKKEHFIWFVKLPLDELGLLDPVSRDELVQYLIKQIEKKLILNTHEPNSQQQGALPHGFTPGEESMAVFHSKVSNLLGHAASKHYQHARNYLLGKQGYDQWAFLTVQGLADVTSQINEDNNQTLLINALKEIPEIPFSLICRLLEHEAINDDIANTIIQRIESESENGANEYKPDELVAGIRGISYMQSIEKRQAFLARVLKGCSADNIEVLAAIAGRCWNDLKNPTLSKLFLEALAKNNQGQHGFENLLVDLLVFPGLRKPIMSALRSPERSAELATAIGYFFTRLNQ
jgi:hypothetical protein